MRIGKTVAGAIVLLAAGVMYYMGESQGAMTMATFGLGLIAVGLGHKADRLLQILNQLVLKK